jgi:hypothetical protein
LTTSILVQIALRDHVGRLLTRWLYLTAAQSRGLRGYLVSVCNQGPNLAVFFVLSIRWNRVGLVEATHRRVSGLCRANIPAPES